MATDHNGDEYSVSDLQQILAVSDRLGLLDSSAKWRREIARNQES